MLDLPTGVGSVRDMNNSTYRTFDSSIWEQVGEETYEKRYTAAIKKGLEPCTICGRGVAEGRGWGVLAVNGGDFLAVDQWDSWETDQTVDHAGDMGFWLLGPECGKRIPSEYRKEQ